MQGAAVTSKPRRDCGGGGALRRTGNRGSQTPPLPSPTAASGTAQAAFQAVLGFAFSSKNGTISARKEPKGKEYGRKERGSWKRGKWFQQKEEFGREERREKKQSK